MWYLQWGESSCTYKEQK